jgi:head-tail adaptor
VSETVTRLRAGTVADPYSSSGSTTSWDAATRLDLEATAVEPRPSGEPVQDARNAVVAGYTVYLAGRPDITAQDRLEVRGESHDVIGDPADWRSPFSTWAPGLVVQTSRSEG